MRHITKGDIIKGASNMQGDTTHSGVTILSNASEFLPNGLRPKCRRRKIPSFGHFLRLFFALELTKYSHLKHRLKHIFREGLICQKTKKRTDKPMKTLKMAKNKNSNLIASVKMVNIDFIEKCIINSGKRLFNIS